MGIVILFLGASSWAQTPALGDDPNMGPPQPEVRVTASSLRVRTADGTHVCSVPKGTTLAAVGRDGGQNRIKVRINAPGCPGEGFVASSYVRPVTQATLDAFASVKVSQLSLRSEPSPSGNYQCGLNENTSLHIIQEDIPNAASASWVKVRLKNPVPDGCPAEGFVNSNYLTGNDTFKNLPPLQVADLAKNSELATGTEGTVGCITGDCDREIAGTRPPAKPIQQIQNLTTAIEDGRPKNDFVEALREMARNPAAEPKGYSTSRGLIQMPLQGNRKNIGPCGSFHFRANEPMPPGSDSYINPISGCAFTAFLQDWTKNECRMKGGCRVAWGDISHKTIRGNHPDFAHSEHTDGHCIDIRPLRRGIIFEDAGITTSNRDYNRKKTSKMIEKLRAFGADRILFGGRDHQDHIHACFNPGPRTREVCEKLRIDSTVCPELL